jgi:hypothetical protein
LSVRLDYPSQATFVMSDIWAVVSKAVDVPIEMRLFVN